MKLYDADGKVWDGFQWTGDADQLEDPDWIVQAIRDGRVTFRDSGTPEVTMIISGGRVPTGTWLLWDGKQILAVHPVALSAHYRTSRPLRPEELYTLLVVGLGIMVLSWWVCSSVMEAGAYNRLRAPGMPEATVWDAMWLPLRATGGH